MCRFILVKTKKKQKPIELLKEFALMCAKSRTMEGYRHQDGWGIAWFSEIDSKWKLYKSLKPIWQCLEEFNLFPSAKILAVHARSASFLDQRGDISYNQPFIDNNKKCSFVFNGMLKGVSIKMPVKGKIGAQKIWSLFKQNLEDSQPESALKKTYLFLKSNTVFIKGLNIGIALPGKIMAVTGENISSKHFSLQVCEDPDQKIICSEKIGSLKFKPVLKGELISL